MSKRPVRIGITLGDINGVGPEVAVQAARSTWPKQVRLVLVGDREHITSLFRKARRAAPPEWDPTQGDPSAAITCWDPKPEPRPLKYQPGTCSAPAARRAHDWIVHAAQAALRGQLDGIVTAPINKEGFDKAGLDVPGHTELLARCADVKHVDMMLLAGHFRVVLATRHLPLRQVARRLTIPSLVRTIDTTLQGLEWLGSRQRRVAVCGLNPHAGDGGALGTEESTVIAPAMQRARVGDAQLVGPVPADTVFHQVRQRAYDAVIAMYHDQGLAAFKMMAFERGVNLTLGLPFVRTSPDHGTAYDLAGTGTANPRSMIEAVKLAIRLAQRPNPWAQG